MQFQQTVKDTISFEGLGVHSGKASRVTLIPADNDHGIVFCNAANKQQKFTVGTVIPEVAMHATVIKTAQWFVSTVEHLMAALSMLGIDNVLIEVEGNEIPILDGSALPFVHAILDTGIKQQTSKKYYLTPKTELTFADQAGRKIHIMPTTDKKLVFEYSADFKHPLAGATTMQGTVTYDFFVKELAPARTWGFLEQLPFLRHHNLAQGTSLGNTVVIGEQELLNEMRLPDECIRHKVLDLIGDLSLLGKNLVGTVHAHKTSHNFNRIVIEHFVQHSEQWELL